jgi:glycosyltransferase involved in cell wall biosynthesis
VVSGHNRRALTERFLSCVSKQTFRDLETIVVDDGFTDGTAELITERFNDVQLLRADGSGAEST